MKKLLPVVIIAFLFYSCETDFDVSAPYTNTTTTFGFTGLNNYEINFDIAPNAWVYNMTIRFHYKEVNAASQDTSLKYIDWDLGDAPVGSATTATYSVYRPDLYRVIGHTL